jgi:hypothetical protein
LQPPLFYDNDYRNVIEMMVNLLILRNYWLSCIYD